MPYMVHLFFRLRCSLKSTYTRMKKYAFVLTAVGKVLSTLLTFPTIDNFSIVLHKRDTKYKESE